MRTLSKVRFFSIGIALAAMCGCSSVGFDYYPRSISEEPIETLALIRPLRSDIFHGLHLDGVNTGATALEVYLRPGQYKLRHKFRYRGFSGGEFGLRIFAAHPHTRDCAGGDVEVTCQTRFGPVRYTRISNSEMFIEWDLTTEQGMIYVLLDDVKGSRIDEYVKDATRRLGYDDFNDGGQGIKVPAAFDGVALETKTHGTSANIDSGCCGC